MKDRITYDVFRVIGPGLMRIVEGYEALAEAKNAAFEILADKRWPEEDVVVHRIHRTQYEMADLRKERA